MYMNFVPVLLKTSDGLTSNKFVGVTLEKKNRVALIFFIFVFIFLSLVIGFELYIL